MFSLGQRQPTEVEQLYQLGLTEMHARQLGEGFIKREEVFRRFGQRRGSGFQIHSEELATTAENVILGGFFPRSKLIPAY